MQRVPFGMVDAPITRALAYSFGLITDIIDPIQAVSERFTYLANAFNCLAEVNAIKSAPKQGNLDEEVRAPKAQAKRNPASTIVSLGVSRFEVAEGGHLVKRAILSPSFSAGNPTNPEVNLGQLFGVPQTLTIKETFGMIAPLNCQQFQVKTCAQLEQVPENKYIFFVLKFGLYEGESFMKDTKKIQEYMSSVVNCFNLLAQREESPWRLDLIIQARNPKCKKNAPHLYQVERLGSFDDLVWGGALQNFRSECMAGESVLNFFKCHPDLKNRAPKQQIMLPLGKQEKNPYKQAALLLKDRLTDMLVPFTECINNADKLAEFQTNREDELSYLIDDSSWYGLEGTNYKEFPQRQLLANIEQYVQDKLLMVIARDQLNLKKDRTLDMEMFPELTPEIILEILRSSDEQLMIKRQYAHLVDMIHSFEKEGGKSVVTHTPGFINAHRWVLKNQELESQQLYHEQAPIAQFVQVTRAYQAFSKTMVWSFNSGNGGEIQLYLSTAANSGKTFMAECNREILCGSEFSIVKDFTGTVDANQSVLTLNEIVISQDNLALLKQLYGTEEHCGLNQKYGAMTTRTKGLCCISTCNSTLEDQIIKAQNKLSRGNLEYDNNGRIQRQENTTVSEPFQALMRRLNPITMEVSASDSLNLIKKTSLINFGGILSSDYRQQSKLVIKASIKQEFFFGLLGANLKKKETIVSEAMILVALKGLVFRVYRGLLLFNTPVLINPASSEAQVLDNGAKVAQFVRDVSALDDQHHDKYDHMVRTKDLVARKQAQLLRNKATIEFSQILEKKLRAIGKDRLANSLQDNYQMIIMETDEAEPRVNTMTAMDLEQAFQESYKSFAKITTLWRHNVEGIKQLLDKEEYLQACEIYIRQVVLDQDIKRMFLKVFEENYTRWETQLSQLFIADQAHGENSSMEEDSYMQEEAPVTPRKEPLLNVQEHFVYSDKKGGAIPIVEMISQDSAMKVQDEEEKEQVPQMMVVEEEPAFTAHKFLAKPDRELKRAAVSPLVSQLEAKLAPKKRQCLETQSEGSLKLRVPLLKEESQLDLAESDSDDSIGVEDIGPITPSVLREPIEELWRQTPQRQININKAAAAYINSPGEIQKIPDDGNWNIHQMKEVYEQCVSLQNQLGESYIYRATTLYNAILKSLPEEAKTIKKVSELKDFKRRLLQAERKRANERQMVSVGDPGFYSFKQGFTYHELYFDELEILQQKRWRNAKLLKLIKNKIDLIKYAGQDNPEGLFDKTDLDRSCCKIFGKPSEVICQLGGKPMFTGPTAEQDKKEFLIQLINAVLFELGYHNNIYAHFVHKLWKSKSVAEKISLFVISFIDQQCFPKLERKDMDPKHLIYLDWAKENGDEYVYQRCTIIIPEGKVSLFRGETPKKMGMSVWSLETKAKAEKALIEEDIESNKRALDDWEEADLKKKSMKQMAREIAKQINEHVPDEEAEVPIRATLRDLVEGKGEAEVAVEPKKKQKKRAQKQQEKEVVIGKLFKVTKEPAQRQLKF